MARWLPLLLTAALAGSAPAQDPGLAPSPTPGPEPTPSPEPTPTPTVDRLMADALTRRVARDYPGAIALLDRAIARQGDVAQARWDRGECHGCAGNWLPALIDLCWAVQLDPSRFDAFSRRAERLAESVDFEHALAVIDAALGERPQDEAPLLLLRGLLALLRLELLGHDEDVAARARDDLERVLRAVPGHAAARVVRARLRVRCALLALAEDPEAELLDAVLDLEQARLDLPRLAEPLYLRALALTALSRAEGPEERVELRRRAVACLGAALEAGLEGLPRRIATEPGFDALRGDPALRRLLAAAGSS